MCIFKMSLVKMPTIKIQKIHSEAIIPKYAHEGDSGADLFSIQEDTLKPGERKVIPTGLKIEIPKGYEAQIRPKSGLTSNYGITVLNTPGTIDSNYRGEIKVILINHSQEPYKIEKGTKIAQIVFQKVETVNFLEDELNKTSRGEDGFGSTGMK